MALLTVGPTSLFPTIADAMVVADPGDMIQLESGYSGETATVTQNGMTVIGDATSVGIVLQLGAGVSAFTDATNGNSSVFGNAGDNAITVLGGVDAVDGGLGTDRLIVDYRAATGAVTGDSTSNFTEAGGGARTVTIASGTFEHFTVLTGALADTLTTGAGDDIISTGGGANTVTAGQGANRITGGNDADTFTALDGGNFMDGGNGANILTSGDGADTVLSGTGADTVVTAGGDDLVVVRGGADSVDAGAGSDRLVIDYSVMSTNVVGGVTAGDLNAGYTGRIEDVAGSTIDFQGVESFVVVTGSGNDGITTGDGDDVLAGLSGSDTLTGGGGDDLFVFQAGFGADTITDFVAGAASVDKISLSAPNLRTLGSVLAQTTQNGAHATVDLGGGDTLELQNVQRSSLSFDDFLGLKATPGDFNGDGRSDLFWRHEGGAFATWEMNGANPNTNGQYSEAVGNDWQMKATGDFDGDGRADLFWRHTGGSFSTWSMDGATATATYYNDAVGNEWTVRATGDFNGDGRDDLMWRHDNGTVSLWNMNGASPIAGVYNAYIPVDWHIVGAGDFDGDGTDDLLWRNDNGDVTTWQFHDNVPTHNILYQSVSLDQHVLGTGDFNGDGRDDILWRQDGGLVSTWEMNGAAYQDEVLASVPADWRLADIGDFNADGRDDLAWRHETGALATWEMNGEASPPTVLYTVVDPSWTVVNQAYELV